MVEQPAPKTPHIVDGGRGDLTGPDGNGGIGMAGTVTLTNRGFNKAASVATGATSEPAAVCWLLIGIAALFLGLFLLLPLGVVFTAAFEKGIGVYLKTFR